jgi:DNA-directed RNA polymerase specialized sigma24 family protein
MNDFRSLIRRQLAPMHPKPTYITDWKGEMTFEQISEDIRPRAAKMLLRQYRVWAQDLDDCLQNGLMYLWEQLIADRSFLAKKSRFEAALIVCHRSKSTSIRRQNLRCEYVEDLWSQSDAKHPEESQLTGLESFKIMGERWATWATLTDIRIDIERAVLNVYEQVKDDPAGLLALYAATTCVTSKDLAYVVPGKGENAIRCRAVAIRNQLRGMLGTLQREQPTWRAKFDAGEVDPAMKLLERHAEHDIKYAAVRGLIEGKSLRQAAKVFGHNVNTLQYHRRRANKELAYLYGCTA